MKTAVELLIQELFNNGYFPYGVPEDLVKKAKAMEKQQMQDLFKAGVNYGSGYVIATEWGEETTEPDFENYYNRNFKSE